MTKRIATSIAVLAALPLLLGNTAPGCGDGLNNRAGEPGLDVGGPGGAAWDVNYSDKLVVVIKNGGAVVDTHNISRAVSGTFNLDGINVDLAALCKRDDVACPQDVFPRQVRMTQPFAKLHLLNVTFNPEGPLDELSKKQATLLGNVDSDFDFSIALGVGAAAAGPCGLLKVSFATGHIEHDVREAPPVGRKLAGDIVTSYSGGCVLVGKKGTVAAGLTVELRLSFEAARR